MNRLLIILSVVLLPALAWAKAPCPGTLSFIDIGSTSDALFGKLKSKDSTININVEAHANPRGVRITDISYGPGQSAELEEGDVILKANGAPVRTRRAFNKRIETLKAGAALTLVISRGGQRQTKTLKMAAWDPLLGALMRHATTQGCRTQYGPDIPSWDEGWLNKTTGAIKCRAYHEYMPGEGQMIIMARDDKRVVLTFPPYSTLCLRAPGLDGKTLNAANVAALFRTLTASAAQKRP